MVSKQFVLNFLHEREMVVVDFCLPAFEVAIVGELSKIDICSGIPLGIHESLVE